MRFRIGLPAMARCTFSSASAAAKMLSSEAPTGTSMVAAALEGARGIGIELDPTYLAVARERMASLGVGAAID